MGIPFTQCASRKTTQYTQGCHKDSNYDETTMTTRGTSHRKQRDTAHTRIHSPSKLRMGIIVFMATLVNYASANTCPAHCSCSVESIAFCNNKGLTSVPTDFTSVVERVYLFNNNITTVEPRSLQPLKNLKLLDLSGNRITNYALWEGIFNQLKLLENLMLQENQIARITKDMFKGLTNLARIYLQDNQISVIEDGAFDNLPNLVELKLRNNRLVSFPRIQQTPDLLLLDLGFNRLRTIRDLALSTVNLEHLKLQSNQLTQLRTSVFDDTSRLTQLDISDNRLTAVPLVIKSLTSLRALNMSLNKVGSLPADTFRGMTRLKVLSMRGMGLKSLPYGIIPPRVILNVLDITENDWDCTCSMHWLPQYIRIFKQAFVNADEIKCSKTSKLRERRIEDLKDEDFGCTEDELARILTPQSTTTIARTPPTATRKQWVADPCDVFPCFNGGTCFVSGRLPQCRCARNWHGSQCQRSLRTTTRTTTTTTTVPRITKSQKVEPSEKPQLLINQESITKDSVEIILPQTEIELIISVSEIGHNQKPTELTIKPMAHPFTVKGLESGKHYNICIHLPLMEIKDRLPPYIDPTDSLCGSVITEGIRVINTPMVTTKITVVPSPWVVNKEETPTEKGEKDPKKAEPIGYGDSQHGVDNPESSGFKIIYPIVGAGIGAIVIIGIVVMLFVCYRRKRMQKMKNQGTSDYIPGSPIDATQMADMELTTVVHHHHHSHYNAGGVEPKVAGKKNALNKKQNNQKSNFINNNSTPKSVTPMKTSSLGRSSNCSTSSGTTEPRYLDSPCHYPPQLQYMSPSPPNHLAYEGIPPQRSARGSEYVYINHQNNNNSSMQQMSNGRYIPMTRPYDPDVVEDMQPLMVDINQHPYRAVDGTMYQDMYPVSPRGEYIPPTGPILYPQINTRSAFQPIQGPRQNTVGTPTSESGPITTHVNTAHVLPTSTCLNRNVMSDNMAPYHEGVPVV